VKLSTHIRLLLHLSSKAIYLLKSEIRLSIVFKCKLFLKENNPVSIAGTFQLILIRETIDIHCDIRTENESALLRAKHRDLHFEVNTVLRNLRIRGNLLTRTLSLGQFYFIVQSFQYLRGRLSSQNSVCVCVCVCVCAVAVV
jgi:hypothetical protein